MIMLERHAHAIVTDSGGVQKEAFFFRKPCITLRDETEWVELVEYGFNRLVGADSMKLVAALSEFSESRLDWSQRLYGNGHAAESVVGILAER